MTTAMNTRARERLTADRLPPDAEQNEHHGSGRALRHPVRDAANLVRAAAGGDQRAWSALVTRYGPTVRAVVRRHRLSKPDQDDVAQRTWLALFRHIESVREPVALGAWLATVTRHECARALASSRREILVDEPVTHDRVDPASLDDLVEQGERRAALHAAVDALPPHERQLLRALLANPEFTYEELSAVLGIPRGSIGPTRGRGIARLRQDPQLARALGHARAADASRSPGRRSPSRTVGRHLRGSADEIDVGGELVEHRA